MRKNIKNIDILKVATIYGANASGKTNVLQAFDYMKKRILVSDEKYKKELLRFIKTFDSGIEKLKQHQIP